MSQISHQLIPADVNRANIDTSPVERNELDLKELLRRRIKWVVFTGLLGGLGGLVYGLYGNPYYEVKSEVLVIRKSPNLPARAATSSTEVENDVTDNLLATHVEILKSPRIVQDGLRRHGLESLPTIEKKRYSFESPTDYVIRQLKVVHGGVEAVDLSANTVRVSFKHISAKDSQKILSAVIESYMDFVATKFQDVSLDAVRLIEQAKSDLELDLKRAEADYISFVRDAPLYWSGELSASGDKRQSIPQKRLEQIEEKLADVRVRYIETSSKLNVIEKALAESPDDEFALAMLDGPALQRLNFFADIVRGDPNRSEAFQVEQSEREQAIRAEYEKQLGLVLESEANNLKYGKNHWKTQEIERKKDSINEFLRKHVPQNPRELKDSVPPKNVLAAYVEMLRKDAEDLKKRQEEYEEMSRSDIASAKEVVNFEVRGEMLRQELNRKRVLHELVIDRLREMNLMKQYGGVVTELIAPVELGRLMWLGVIAVSSWVAVVLSVAAGTFVGCCMGAVLGVFRHLSDNTFGCEEEIERELALPILGHVDQNGIRLRIKKNGTAADLAKAIKVLSQPESASAEAYRQIRNALLLLKFRRDFKILQISDVNPGDDHAVLAANLATAFAEVGQKTLLIDCDLYQCGVSRLYGIPEEKGNAESVLQGADLHSLIRPTSVPGLSIFAAAQDQRGLSDGVFTSNFKHMINSARAEYDLIILSSPSILGRSESLAIATYSDFVLLSLRVNRGKRGSALLARDNLVKLGVNIAGLVVTGADDKSIFGYADLRRAIRRLNEGMAVPATTR